MTCTHCGDPDSRTETHHVDEQRGNNDPDNLSERCPRCHHGRAHDNRRRTDSLTSERYGPNGVGAVSPASPSTGPL